MINGEVTPEGKEDTINHGSSKSAGVVTKHPPRGRHGSRDATAAVVTSACG